MLLNRRDFLGAAAASALVPQALRAQRAPRLDELVARHVAARGGAAALDRSAPA